MTVERELRIIKSVVLIRKNARRTKCKSSLAREGMAYQREDGHANMRDHRGRRFFVLKGSRRTSRHEGPRRGQKPRAVSQVRTSKIEENREQSMKTQSKNSPQRTNFTGGTLKTTRCTVGLFLRTAVKRPSRGPKSFPSTCSSFHSRGVAGKRGSSGRAPGNQKGRRCEQREGLLGKKRPKKRRFIRESRVPRRNKCTRRTCLTTGGGPRRVAMLEVSFIAKIQVEGGRPQSSDEREGGGRYVKDIKLL